MERTIRKKLLEIEQAEGVRILLAVESGSRAWGFASPDSDYDVRFIYARDVDFYLRLDKTRDVIEWQLDETFDINGWDARKALGLIASSNPTVFEWMTSEIVYRTSAEFAEWRNIFLRDYFSPRTSLYHYLNMARNNGGEFLQTLGSVRYKKYLYALRAMLAAKWVACELTQPPIAFADLVEAQLDAKLVPLVEDLVAQKKNSSEMGKGPAIRPLNGYIEDTLAELYRYADEVPAVDGRDWVELNRAFQKFATQTS